MTGWQGPYATVITILIIGMAAAVGLTAIAAEIYDAVSESDGVAGLDEPLFAAANSIRTPWLDTAATYHQIRRRVGQCFSEHARRVDNMKCGHRDDAFRVEVRDFSKDHTVTALTSRATSRPPRAAPP